MRAPEYFYTFKGKRCESQAGLPREACKPGKHSWVSDEISGKNRCTLCGAIRVAKPPHGVVGVAAKPRVKR